MTVIEMLAAKLDKTESEVVRFLATAPLKYKVYTIPKRTSGHRLIAQPSKDLKDYQRAFLQIQSLPIHDAAMAYRNGLSIKDNAKRHKHHRYLLKLDLVNFFNSITSECFWSMWANIIALPSEKDRALLEKLLFWSPSKSTHGKLILSIGAPSSPLISNFFMYQFDVVITELTNKQNIAYTRYADDLTFSTNQKDILFSIPDMISEQLRKLFGTILTINRRKTVFSSKAHNRHVTGITINNSGALSLGRERKRYIKHLVHHFQVQKLNKEDIKHLQGLLLLSI
tara:strand:+ start:9621 stop:10469 length:849 start_codon:yes stop_codon:yes gene_type:complete